METEMGRGRDNDRHNLTQLCGYVPVVAEGALKGTVVFWGDRKAKTSDWQRELVRVDYGNRCSVARIAEHDGDEKGDRATDRTRTETLVSPRGLG